MKVHFQRLHPNAKLPCQNNSDDAGYDVFAALDEPVVIPAGSSKMVVTGWNIGIMNEGVGKGMKFYSTGELPNMKMHGVPFVWVAKACSRSGLAAKHNVFVLNAPGIIDVGYRGELKIILYNAGQNDYTVNSGDRIAQLLFERVFLPEVKEVEILDATERGQKGFGSSGQ